MELVEGGNQENLVRPTRKIAGFQQLFVEEVIMWSPFTLARAAQAPIRREHVFPPARTHPQDYPMHVAAAVPISSRIPCKLIRNFGVTGLQ